MTENAVTYLEKSFLAPLLTNEEVTDISFNGGELFFVSNKTGRQKSSIQVGSDEVTSFLRQIANLTEKSINLANPILDVSFGRYRLNGVNSSIGRFHEEKAPSFSLRLASRVCKIEKDMQFLDEKGREILRIALKKHRSIVIGGQTRTGKTELQKWLLLNLPTNTRVIVLDNVEELDLVHNERIDMTTWLSGDGAGKLPLNVLIRNALRHNPDYLLVAEARGEEMLDALASPGSGHPLITTIHADSLESMPHRLARMALMAGSEISLSELYSEVLEHITYFVFLEKMLKEGEEVHRYVRSIGEINSHTKQMQIIYERREE